MQKRFLIALLLIVQYPIDSIPAPQNQQGVQLKPLGFSEYLRFNRAEGLYTGLGMRINAKGASATISSGYATSARRWQYNTSLGMVRRYRFGYLWVGAELYDKSRAVGSSDIGSGGNSLSALFFKQDHLDYFGEKGFALTLSNRYQYWNIAIQVEREKNFSLPLATQKSWSWRNIAFRENPAIDAGDYHGINLKINFDKVETPGVYPKGQQAQIELIKAGGGILGGSFDFFQARLSGRIFLRGLWSHLFRVNLEAAGSRQNLPKQYRFYLGGPASLRSEPVNKYAGNHYWFLSADHFLPPGPFKYLRFPNPFFHSLRPIVFADAGSAWTSTKILDKPKDIRSSFGLAVGDTGNLFRVNCAWSFDRIKSSPLWTILFSYKW